MKKIPCVGEPSCVLVRRRDDVRVALRDDDDGAPMFDSFHTEPYLNNLLRGLAICCALLGCEGPSSGFLYGDAGAGMQDAAPELEDMALVDQGVFDRGVEVDAHISEDMAPVDPVDMSTPRPDMQAEPVEDPLRYTRGACGWSHGDSWAK